MMLNKALRILNIFAIFVLITLLCAYAARAEEPLSTYHHCKIETGDVGNFHYRAVTLHKAMLKTTEACLDARMELHLKVKGEKASSERYAEYLLACVNDNVCWEK